MRPFDITISPLKICAMQCLKVCKSAESVGTPGSLTERTCSPSAASVTEGRCTHARVPSQSAHKILLHFCRSNTWKGISTSYWITKEVVAVGRAYRCAVHLHGERYKVVVILPEKLLLHLSFPRARVSRSSVRHRRHRPRGAAEQTC